MLLGVGWVGGGGHAQMHFSRSRGEVNLRCREGRVEYLIGGVYFAVNCAA